MFITAVCVKSYTMTLDNWLNQLMEKPCINKIILSYLISSHLISSHLISTHLNSTHLISSHLISTHLISSHLISSHLISSHLISSHLISSHLILSYLILSYSVMEEGWVLLRIFYWRIELFPPTNPHIYFDCGDASILVYVYCSIGWLSAGNPSLVVIRDFKMWYGEAVVRRQIVTYFRWRHDASSTTAFPP